MSKFLTDAHCHADFLKFAGDGGLNIGIPLCAAACFYKTWLPLKNANVATAKKAFGLHPDSDISAEEFFSKPVQGDFFECLQHADAVGETGLDARLADKTPMPKQEALFEAQLGAAKAHGLPAILHCVGAWGRLEGVLKNSGIKKFLIHAAKCSPEMVAAFEKIGGYFSFGLRELESPKGADCARAVDASRILVESDALPSAQKISAAICIMAKVRSQSEKSAAENTFNNFNEFYAK